MKIRLGIVDTDKLYIEKLVAALNRYYCDKVEISSYTDIEYAKSVLKEQRLDIILVDYGIELKEFKNCEIVYLVEDPEIDCIDDRKAICKYQRIDAFYKELLSIYADYSAKTTKQKRNKEEATIITFVSPFGSVGNSTVAAAFAFNCALNNRSAIYINLEDIATTDIIFTGESKYTFTDVVYALKSKKNNLSIKLESYTVTDPTGAGVDFFKVQSNPMDTHELNKEDINLFFREIKSMGLYDYIIVDVSYRVNDTVKETINLSDKIVVVVDGNEKNIAKSDKAFQLMNIHLRPFNVFEQACFVINNQTNATNNPIYSSINIVLELDRIENSSYKGIIETLSYNQGFSRLY